MLSTILVGTACHKKEEVIGPEYSVASSRLLVTNFSPASTSINFGNKENQYFNANLSERVSWKITLLGQESKATKVIEGISEEINENNSSWNGVQDGIQFFKNEKVLATLTFLGSDKTLATEFDINATYNYPEAIKLGNGFEGTSWQGPWFDPGENNGSGKINTLSIQGEFSYNIIGTDLDGSYYIGVIRKSYQSELPENANDVYFNIYVYGKGDASSVLKLAGKEDENGNAEFEDNSEDAWEKEITLGHTGWKLFSFKYSEFERSVNKNFGGNGNNKREPHKIMAVDIALQTKIPYSKAEAIFDLPVITVGKPFNPNNL